MRTKVKEKVHAIVSAANLPRHVCNHVLGEEHTTKHRMVAGAVVMVIGVGINRGCMEFTVHLLHWFGEIFGYLVHGLGCAPFVEYAITANKFREPKPILIENGEVKVIFEEKEKE